MSSPPEYFDFNGEHVTDKNKIVNGFNHFYVNIGPNLCKSQPPCNVNATSYLRNRNMYSMFIEPTNEQEIHKIIMALKESAAGWDELSAKVLKKCASHILFPLTHVFNMSFRNGVFPTELKLAKVIPLYKGDSKYILSNYRPVSVLPVLSKILERLIVLVEMLKIPSSARFLCSFSNFWFGDPLGSIKYENLGGQFF